MGLITGIGAAVDGIRCLQRWEIELLSMDEPLACSDTEGAVARGDDVNKDWRGTANGYGHTPPKLPGDTFLFTGVDREGEGWVSGASACLVNELKLFCRPQKSPYFFWQMAFISNGSLATTSTDAIAATAQTVYGSSCKNVAVDEAACTGVSEWDLHLKGNVTEPLWLPENSGWPNRAVGNKDAMVSYLQQFDDPGDLVENGDISQFWLYATDVVGSTPATYWDIKWAKVLSIKPAYVINDGQARPQYVGASITAGFTSVKDGAHGYLKTPAGTAWWEPA